LLLQPTPENIIRELFELHSPEIAFLSFQNQIYYSSVSFTPYRPISALTTLIQGIYEKYPVQAKSIIRNRIYSTASSSAMDYGMIKVAAKRFTNPVICSEKVSDLFLDKVLIHFVPSSRADWPFHIPIPTNSSEMIHTIQKLRHTVSHNFHLYDSDRPIAALLVSQDDKVLAWGTNSNSKNKTLHAEVNMLQSFYLKKQAPLPPGSTIYTTLKPCKMCAGMIWSSALDPSSIQVLYLEDDLGPMAQQTVLDLNSLERKKFSQNHRELITNILNKIT
jgi:tRNA(Arg) A34 adenosine deaminase TadA